MDSETFRTTAAGDSPNYAVGLFVSGMIVPLGNECVVTTCLVEYFVLCGSWRHLADIVHAHTALAIS